MLTWRGGGIFGGFFFANFGPQNNFSVDPECRGAEVKQLVFFLGNFGRCEHSFRVQVKKFFEKKKKNYNLKTVYDKHSIDFFKKKIF